MILDVDAVARHADRLILAGGRESRGNLTYQPAAVLATTLCTSVVDFPGAHTGMVTHPTEFARQLIDVLDR